MKSIMKKIIIEVEKYSKHKETQEVFNKIFQKSETMNDALESIDSFLKTSFFDDEVNKDIAQMVSIIKDTYREKLNDSVYNIDIEGLSVDSRFININNLKRILKTTVFSYNNAKYHDAETNIYYTNDKDLKDRLLKPNIIDTSKITDDIRKSYSDIDECNKILLEKVISKIRDNNQATSISYKSDPFLTETLYVFKDQNLEVVSNRLFSVTPKFVDRPEFVNDFKEHFDIDTCLDFILAVRFGDRKKSYMWLRAPSNFGKSFLFDGVLKDGLQISTTITESELKASQSGSASCWTAENFKDKWVLFFDEFKSNVKEIKNITHSLSFSPKFKGKVTVDVFAKIFSSAENVSSLNSDGFVEEQFKNRFIFWREEEGKLVERTIYKNNKLEYLEAIRSYAYIYLKNESDQYIELGRYGANNKANEVLERISELKKQDTQDIIVLINERLEEFKNCFIDEISLKNFWYSRNGDIFISNKQKMAEIFIKNHFSQVEQKIVGHKSTDILLGLEGVSRTSHSIDGITKAGYLWLQDTKHAQFTRRERSNVSI